MTRYVEIHPQTPQRRLLEGAAEILRRGGVIVYPTDSTYALGCRLGEREALERIRKLRRLPPTHHFTLACRSLSEISSYARISNRAHRLIRALTPGPYTFVLPGTKLVPRTLMHPKQRTIGLRIPDHPVAQALLDLLDEPLMTTTLLLPDEHEALCDPEDIRERLDGRVDLVLDAGPGLPEPTTLVDLTHDTPEILREGRGDPSRIF